MRFFFIFQFLVLSVLVVSVSSVQADQSTYKQETTLGEMAKYKKYFWARPSHDETRVYLNRAKLPHNSQWDSDEWKPQDWVDARGGSVEAVVNGFYSAGIVTDQYYDDATPVLEVGQRFLDLSELEKRRVAAFFDHVFQVTTGSEGKLFYIYFHKNDIPLGIFNSDGLQLQ